MKRFALILFATTILVVGCSTSYQSAMQSGPSIQYLNNQGDGSITVRVSATGKTRRDALGQARKYAVWQVLFRGVNVTDNVLLSKPLVTEVNAEEKYQAFFNTFFADDGDYDTFTTSEDKRSGSNERAKGKVNVRVVTTVRVLRSELKDYLYNKKILRP